VTIGVEFGSRIVPVGPPASLDLNINKHVFSSWTSALDESASYSLKSPPQRHLKLSIWDSAGQETYRSITRSYFRGASGALLVFDISRRKTFDSVTSWLQDLRLIADEGIVVVLVGNKSDLDTDDTPRRKREVSKAEAEAWAKANNVFSYVETSAKSGAGVERAFREVAERIYQGIVVGRYNLDDRRSGVKRAGVGAGNVKMNVGLDDSGSQKKTEGGCC
jgi:small GTP-binding protein